MTSPLHVLHVPMPLSTAGSTLITVARELSRAHTASGGIASTVLSHNRDARVPESEEHFVDYTRNLPRQYFTRSQTFLDAVSGRITAGYRPNQRALYLPAVEKAERLEPDEILLYEGHYALPSMPAWRKSAPRAKVICYIHNSLSRTYSRSELRSWVEQADGFVFVAEHARRGFIARVGKQYEAKTRVVHNGVSQEFFRGASAESDPRSFAYFGRVSEGKGVHLILQALANLKVPSPVHISLKIIGGGAYGHGDLSPYEVELRRLAGTLPRHVRVEFMPHQGMEGLLEALSDVGTVVLPSLLDEAFPLSVLESLALGKRVIASDSDGMREAGGGHMLEVSRGSVSDLAAAMRRVCLEGAGEAHEGQEWARQFTWESACRSLC